MNQAWCRAVFGGVRLALQIQPGGKRSEVTGCVGDLLKIRLHAEPVDGKANNALISYLAGILDVPKSAIKLARGHTSKRKIVEIKAGI
jgi:uncharacterized protein (TIGR00251 family)